MPAWSLPGPILLALTAPAGGDRDASTPGGKTPMRVIDVVRTDGRGDAVTTRLRLHPEGDVASAYDRRSDWSFALPAPAIRDPQADSVQTLLRDRRARRGGALDARVEWRLSEAGSGLGLGGGLARVVDTLLHD